MKVAQTFTIKEEFSNDPQQHRRAIDRVREILLSVVLIPKPKESILDKNGGGTNGRHA